MRTTYGELIQILSKKGLIWPYLNAAGAKLQLLKIWFQALGSAGLNAHGTF